ncbi:hypothetical protein CJ030_MR8G024576 [Morella rubra]|uniref:Uncharacterized protein n=1 Tax=Morella rubra TaxID=262757 RepID=A0A6A1URW1_9ROSI|nr:hypothetical protein CJ030_MR8G024576 [Morella rubra]
MSHRIPSPGDSHNSPSNVIQKELAHANSLSCYQPKSLAASASPFKGFEPWYLFIRI